MENQSSIPDPVSSVADSVPDFVPDSVAYSGNDDASSFFGWWTWVLIFLLIGASLLAGYYYILYFYDATSLEYAIEKAIKHFNATTAEARGVTGATGDTGYTSDTEEEYTKKRIVKKVLDKVLDDASSEGFSTFTPTAPLGGLNWSMIDNNNMLLSDPSEPQITDDCMSGDIFPTRSICINPKLRTMQ